MHKNKSAHLTDTENRMSYTIRCFLRLNLFFDKKIITGSETLFTFRLIHVSLLDVLQSSYGFVTRTRAQPFGMRSAPLQNDDRASASEEIYFLPAESDSSFLKVPSWQLSTDVIYWKQGRKETTILYQQVRIMDKYDKKIPVGGRIDLTNWHQFFMRLSSYWWWI